MFHLFLLQIQAFIFFNSFLNHFLLQLHFSIKNQFLFQSMLHFLNSTPFIKFNPLFLRNTLHIIIIMLLQLLISLCLNVNYMWNCRFTLNKSLYVIVFNAGKSYVIFIQKFWKISSKWSFGDSLPNNFINHIKSLTRKFYLIEIKRLVLMMRTDYFWFVLIRTLNS